ncbi:uncharacterized protein LOC114319721 [Camellia sinensis]|uniref:uncharacterized protein LOC114319721 n=1 Tax=Camellia sinensis TaxID=4442 RepID=UPI0010366BBA|nr:uncharacterized protein LOC114319721 [Camellia sinensis]
MVRMKTDDPEDSTFVRLDTIDRMIKEMEKTLRQQQQQQQPPHQYLYHHQRSVGVGYGKVFEVFPCAEAQKVQFGAFTLENEARRWRMLTRTIHQGLTWARFLELFYEKYFPQCMRDKKVTEFETLRQGNKTVAEYEAQFSKLAHFAPHMVDTDYKKARKFEGGLRTAILDRINVLKLPTYVDVLERAVIAEGNIATQSRVSVWKEKRQNTQVTRGSVAPSSKKLNSGTSSTSASTCDSAPICPNCGKRHRGICYRVTRACFKCGKTGHLVRECPQKDRQNGNKTTTSSVGSTPTPTTKTATKHTNTEDTAKQKRAFALILGDVQNTETVVDANLLPLDMAYFDIILGMDWLSECHTTIDCMLKQVTFQPPGQPKSIFKGLWVISSPYLIFAIKVCKLLQKGCQRYLCSILGEQPVDGGIDAIPIVQDFQDAFPEELPGELIDREIEFTIDIVSGTQPISKTPYRMSPAKMKELKFQFQDLLDKGFIRPSTSLGAH